MRFLLPCSDSSATPSSPSQLEWMIGLPWCRTRVSLRSSSCLRRKPPWAPQLEEHLRRALPHELRSFFSCMAWRAIPSPLSKLKRRLDSLEATLWAPRDPRRGSRGERSPLLPLEAKPDSPVESGVRPRDPCLPMRGLLGPGHTPR